MSVEEKLYEYYYDPAIGFTSEAKLYARLKEDGLSVTHKKIKEFIKSQETAQLNTSIPKPKQYNSVVASAPLDDVQMDVMIYDRYAFNGYNAILCFVDVHSRFAWARALTNHKIPTIVKMLKDVFKDKWPKSISCDQEFNVKEINNLAKTHNITMHFSQAYEVNKQAIVERFNGTLAKRIQKWRTATGQYDWNNVLQDIIGAYNNSIHKTIKAKPKDVFNGDDKNYQLPVTISNPFQLNERVRVAVDKEQFQKGDKIMVSKEIYKIVEIDGNKIYVEDEAGNRLPIFYKPYQLKLVGKVERYKRPEPKEKPHEVIHNEIQDERKLKKGLNKEGIDREDILEEEIERPKRKVDRDITDIIENPKVDRPKRPQKAATEFSWNEEDLKQDNLIVAAIEGISPPYSVAKVLKISGKTIKIQWYGKKARNTSLTAVQYPGRIDQKDGKAYFQEYPKHKDDEPWTATIPKSSIIVTRLDSNYLDTKANADINKEAKRVLDLN